MIFIVTAAFFLGALIVRPVIHRFRTGRWGLHGFSGERFTPGWWGGASFALSMILTPIALMLEPHEAITPLGPALAIIGTGFTFFAQSAMGASWRIGVRESDRTTLVTTGLFTLVRNPIFTGMLTFAIGLTLWWPNFASLAALVLLLIAVELQVRFVEEPYLERVHGHAWKSWASRVGRFVPRLGLVR